MEAILVNYNYTPDWLGSCHLLSPITIYDRSDDSIERNLQQYGKTIRSKNFGDVDYDKLTWLVENYHDLPEVFVWGKSNLFKYCDKADFEKGVLKSDFTPLLKYDHRIYSDVYGEVNKYVGTAHGPMYAERSDSWFFNAGLDSSGKFKNWFEWAYAFRLPVEPFIPFAPGGSYILTRERVHRYSKDFYEEMRATLPYAAHPVEAHCCERSYYYLWR